MGKLDRERRPRIMLLAKKEEILPVGRPMMVPISKSLNMAANMEPAEKVPTSLSRITAPSNCFESLNGLVNFFLTSANSPSLSAPDGPGVFVKNIERPHPADSTRDESTLKPVFKRRRHVPVRTGHRPKGLVGKIAAEVFRIGVVPAVIEAVVDDEVFDAGLGIDALKGLIEGLFVILLPGTEQIFNVQVGG
jgi:hypothetical protein